MGRIPDNEIKKLKAEVSLLRLIESQGYSPQKQGKDHALRCPFHADDNTPSLIISPQNNLFHCFGCGAAGSVIDWVMKTQGVSFRHAVTVLKEDAGLVTESKANIKRSTTKTLPPLAAEADNQKIIHQVVDYYHQTLKQSPEALAYLESRGLKSSELIDTFKLGYANRTLAYRLPEKQVKAGKEIRSQLQDIGLLRKSGHEHFNGSLVVPTISEQNQISEIYGRKILGNKLRKGTPQHLYLPGAHQGVWNEKALMACRNGEIILCEALIDAMTFWVNGFRNVTASYGTAGFTEDHITAFKTYNIKRILIAYDRDEAGNTATDKLAHLLNENGIDAFRILLPKGMDVNEFAQQVIPAQKSLGLAIRKAQWLGKGKSPKISTAQESLLSNLKAESIASEPEASTNAAESTQPEQNQNPSPNHPPLAAALAVPLPLPEPSTTTPLPEVPKLIEANITDHEISMILGDRTYRIRGLSKNMSHEQLKVNLLVNRGEYVHIDTLDLYQSRPRHTFIKQSASELGVPDEVIKKDLGKILLKLEQLQDQHIKNTLSPEEQAPPINAEQQQQALELLQDTNLLQRILEDFKTAGVVGEETNKLVGYLACVSRKLDKPLAVIIQSSSAAGKSSLMDAILNLMPEEERVQYSAMTGQSLFYMGESNLKNKILAIAEEKGAEQASYALKLLQSEGELTIASTGKDDATGNMVTKEYHVEGPVMLFLTTTAIDIDEELMNRCLILTVNESREQTQAIQHMQRKQQTLEGLLQSEDKKHITQLHRNAQRLIKPLLVANPYAEQLTFIDDKTRTRRDHMKYLTLIKAITLLHQYQREIKSIKHHGQNLNYIEVTKTDIETANRLAHEILGRTLDELPPQTRTLLKHIQQMITQQSNAQNIEQQDIRFSRREIRDFTGWSDGQLKIHCSRLTELEYLLIHRGGRGQSLVYELLYDGRAEQQTKHLMGLINPEKLSLVPEYDENKSGQNREKTAPSQAQVRAKSGASQRAKNSGKPGVAIDCPEPDKKTAEKGYRANNKSASHPNPILAASSGQTRQTAQNTMAEG